MSVDLKKVTIGTSRLTGEVYTFRHGAYPVVALDKRPAEQEMFVALVEHMMFEAPKGASRIVSYDGGTYEITVKPVEVMN